MTQCPHWSAQFTFVLIQKHVFSFCCATGDGLEGSLCSLHQVFDVIGARPHDFGLASIFRLFLNMSMPFVDARKSVFFPQEKLKLFQKTQIGCRLGGFRVCTPSHEAYFSQKQARAFQSKFASLLAPVRDSHTPPHMGQTLDRDFIASAAWPTVTD